MKKIYEISNPMLESAMELIKKNNTPANSKIFIDELLHAKLLAQVIITPAPVFDEDGKPKLTPDHKIQMPMVTAANGKKYFEACTNIAEMRRMKIVGHANIIPFGFKEYMMMLAQAKDTCDGMVINPHSTGLVLNKETMVAIFGSLAKKEGAGKKTEAPESQAEAAEKQTEVSEDKQEA